MASKEIPHISKRAKLAKKRYSDEFGDAAWSQTKSALTPAEIRRQAIQQQRRQSEHDLVVLDEEIDTAWEGVSKGTGSQKIACIRQLEDAYEKQDEIKSTLGSMAAMDPSSASKHRKAGSASSSKIKMEHNVSQTAHYVSNSLNATDQIARHSEEAKNRIASGLPPARATSSLNFTSHIPRPQRMFSMSNPFQKTSSSANGETRAESVHSLPRLSEALRNHPRKRSEISEESEGLDEGLSGLPRSRMRLNTGMKKYSLSNGSKTASQSEATQATVEETTADMAKEKLEVTIPADTDMATDLREYSQWPDNSGALASTQGCLLPAKYDFSGILGFEWICPVRSCRRCFQSLKKLGGHFSSHYSCLLNDNCDGTFTIVGKYTQSKNGKSRPALVKSKNHLPNERMLQPQPPATWVTVQQRKRFAEGLKKARSRTSPDPCGLKTVDEMMLDSAVVDISSDDTSEASESSELPQMPSSLGTQKRFTESVASSSDETWNDSSSSPGSDGEITNHFKGPNRRRNRVKHEEAHYSRHGATQENWGMIRKYFGIRKYDPPETGHFAALLATPRSRDIVLRPGMRFIADGSKIELLIVHMTGKEPPVPCKSCALGRGPFKDCVAINKEAAGDITNGILCCTNCACSRNLGQSCNLKDLCHQPAARPIDTQRKQRQGISAPESREQSGLGSISSRVTKVDGCFTFAVHVLQVDSSLDLDAEPVRARLCSVAAGKVLVEMEGIMPFMIGPHGMFKLIPDMSAQVSNASEAEAVLHVSTLKS
ncbi:hypothetical protein F5883DRAFT_643033 [Diaporthe sp. PMI_573]|nr:hypothetical protein F5883DRAFT_643033 [Diaporthaceae sp. PMI_573]